MEAVKRYGSVQQSPIDELKTSLEIFRNHLKLIDDLMMNFNATNFYGICVEISAKDGRKITMFKFSCRVCSKC